VNPRHYHLLDVIHFRLAFKLLYCLEFAPVQHFRYGRISHFLAKAAFTGIIEFRTRQKTQAVGNGTIRAVHVLTLILETAMLSIHVDNIGDLAIIECQGRIVRSEAALRLRQAVILQSDARVIVLELSEVSAIEGGGLGMLLFLQRWAYDHNIRLKVFNPTLAVRERLERANSIPDIEIATLDEMMGLLAQADHEYAQAA
jgi:anti-anti-sigma regulatory factor